MYDCILLLIAMYHQNLQTGFHSLYLASFNGNLECVELLLDRGAQIDLPTNVSYHCNMYYQCSLAMHMTVSLMYVCIPGIPPEQNPNRVLNDIHRLLIKLWL